MSFLLYFFLSIKFIRPQSFFCICVSCAVAHALCRCAAVQSKRKAVDYSRSSPLCSICTAMFLPFSIYFTFFCFCDPPSFPSLILVWLTWEQSARLSLSLSYSLHLAAYLHVAVVPIFLYDCILFLCLFFGFHVAFIRSFILLRHNCLQASKDLIFLRDIRCIAWTCCFFIYICCSDGKARAFRIPKSHFVLHFLVHSLKS